MPVCPDSPLPALTDSGARTRAQRMDSEGTATVRDVEPWDTEAEPRPERIGRYRVDGELGRGGMGVVYRAHDPSLDRAVAIKLVRPRAHGGADAHERLAREARTLAKLSHPNVVEIFEIGTFDGQLFIAMELVVGDTLRQWQCKRTPSVATVVDVMLQAGRGLAAAHAQGLVHRDFKPDNVMIGDDHRPRILDFGLAHAPDGSLSTSAPVVITASDDRLTQTGLAMGTPAYMAPEQFRGTPGNPHFDQFAFCVTCFEMLSGGRPYAGETFADLARSTAGGTLDEKLAATIPRRLLKVLRKGLLPNPADRYASMDALLSAMAGQRRRRMGPVAAVALASLGLAGWWVGSDEVERCPDTATNRAALWPQERAAAVRAAIENTGLQYAASVGDEVEAAMSRYAEVWGNASNAACEAMRAAPKDDERTGRWIDCLSARRVASDAALQVLETIDAQSLHNAPRIIAGLPAVASCQPSARPTGTSPTPRAEDGALWRPLARIEAALELGRYSAGLAEIELLMAELPETSSSATRALTQHMHGRLLTATGRALAGADAMEAAYFAAQDGQRYDLACRAASAIAGHSAVAYERRWKWARHAEAAADRHDDPDAESVLAYDAALCALQRDSGNLADAIVRCESVLTAVQARGVVDVQAEVTALRRLAQVVSAADDHERAYTLSQTALARSEHQWGEHHPVVADAAMSLGDEALQRGRHAEAETLGLRALAIRQDALGDDHPDLASALDLLSAVALATGDPAKARDLAERSRLARATAYGDTHPLVARSLYARALAEEALTDYDAALRSMELVSEIDEQLHPLNIDRLPTLREQARMAFEFGDGPKKGRQYLERAWQIVEQSAIPATHPLVRDLNHGYGETLVELGEAEAALPYLEAFVADPRPHRVLPHLQFVLARALTNSGKDPQRGRALVRQALATWGDSDDTFARQEVARMRAWLLEHP